MIELRNLNFRAKNIKKNIWLENSNETFLIIFKHCDSIKELEFSRKKLRHENFQTLWMDFGNWPMKYEFFSWLKNWLSMFWFINMALGYKSWEIWIFAKPKKMAASAKEFFNQNHKSKFNHQYLSKKWLSCKKPFMKLASSGKP